MRRREFITLLGGAAAAWPLAARAQQPASGKWRVGMLAGTRRVDVFRRALRELGYLESNNLTIDARPNDRPDRLPTFVAELLALRPEVIVAIGTQSVQAVQQATNSVPIVMLASDPVGNHLVTTPCSPRQKLNWRQFIFAGSKRKTNRNARKYCRGHFLH
jgi:putative ABC transport system substrate-binding protein